MNQPHGGRWRSALLILSLCIAAVASGAAFRGPAVSAPPPAQPSAVAIVNLKLLFDGLTEFTEGMAVITEQQKTHDSSVGKVRDQFKAAQKELEMLKDPPLVKRIEIQAKLAELEELGKTRAAVLTRVLEVQAGELMRRVFIKIADASDRLAAKDGWDVILIDDRSIVPPERAQNNAAIRADQVEQIIQQRRILTAVKRVDVTASLIEFMNAEYKAGKK